MAFLKIDEKDMIKLTPEQAHQHPRYGMQGSYLAFMCLVGFFAFMSLAGLLSDIYDAQSLVDIVSSLILALIWGLCAYCVWYKHENTIDVIVVVMGVISAVVAAFFLFLIIFMDPEDRPLFFAFTALLTIEIAIAYWARQSVALNLTTRHLIYPNDPAAPAAPSSQEI